MRKPPVSLTFWTQTVFLEPGYKALNRLYIQIFSLVDSYGLKQRIENIMPVLKMYKLLLFSKQSKSGLYIICIVLKSISNIEKVMNKYHTILFKAIDNLWIWYANMVIMISNLGILNMNILI